MRLWEEMMRREVMLWQAHQFFLTHPDQNVFLVEVVRPPPRALEMGGDISPRRMEQITITRADVYRAPQPQLDTRFEEREARYVARHQWLKGLRRFIRMITVKADEDPLELGLSERMARSLIDYRGRRRRR